MVDCGGGKKSPALASFEPQERYPLVLRIDLTVSEETRVKEIQDAINALGQHAGLPLDRNINAFKNDSTDVEFIDLCKRIADRFP